jgi:hypothetical protein
MRRILRFWTPLMLVTVVALTAGASAVRAADESPYAGADKCGPCHQAIYHAWQATKHAKALMKLDASQRKSDCIRCHVTGTPEMIAADGDNPSLPNVQCEACHGPAAAHAKDPKVRTGLTAKPGEAVCTTCHNDQSPKFRGFVYAAMKSFVHQTN